MPSAKAIVGSAVVAALAVGAGVVLNSKHDAPAGCVARPNGVKTCLRNIPPQGSRRPELRDVVMSEGTPFPASDAVGVGCVPVPCEAKP